MSSRSIRNQLRIIGGTWRGRKIRFADIPGIRPTPDRVRETLFNWLAPAIRGSRCLDLFAGSGVLGLEAASRGAGDVVMVDASREAVSLLREQVSVLQAHRVQVIQGLAEKYLGGAVTPFDIVFLDPPFGKGLLEPVMQQLATGGWLTDPAWIYIEAERNQELLHYPDDWQEYRSRVAGQVSYRLLHFTARDR